MWVVGPTLKPFMSASSLIASAKGSMARRKSPGDRGQPCLLNLLNKKALYNDFFKAIPLGGTKRIQDTAIKGLIDPTTHI